MGPLAAFVLAWVRSNAIRIALGGLIMVGVTWFYFHIKEVGALAERLRGYRVAITRVEEAHEIDRKVDHLGDGAAADELRRHWSRD